VTLWEGRMGERPADALMAFTASIDFDRRLAVDDLAGSRAHVRGLLRAGVLTEQEMGILLAALNRVEDELADGTFRFLPSDEDIHTAIERRVSEIAGPAGGKLQTGRSRNDQVATAVRLFTKRQLTEVARGVVGLQEVLYERARTAPDAYLPGYTHLQHAQPVLLAHHLLAHAWALGRDVERWQRVVTAADVSPLGAGALAGSSLPLDPDRTAADLGFARRFENPLDAVSDRDFGSAAWRWGPTRCAPRPTARSSRPPTSPSCSSCGARRSVRRTRSSAPSYGRRSTVIVRSPSWWRRTRASAPRASSASRRAPRSR